MAGFAMNEKSPLAALAAALIALTASGCSPAAREAPPLEGARIGGPFTLTDQSGKRVSDTSFPGKYKLIYFGYTFCPDICPVDLQLIGRGLAAFEKSDPARAAKVQPIFITTDPQRDTPAVLKEYVSNFHPRLIGLTGTPDEIAAVAKGHGVYYSKRESSGMSDYLVDHVRVAILFDPQGKPIVIVPHDQGLEGVTRELDKWVT
jgi:protein SCO1/2